MGTEAELVIFNSSQLLTMSGQEQDGFPHGPRDSSLLGVIPGGAVAVSGGKIVETGTSGEILTRYPGARRIDAGGRLVMPGFVDCHTHLIHGGIRTGEMLQRLHGVSYLDILKSGGGIHSTVKATRETPEEELISSGEFRLKQMMAHGTTTVEVKSGYGLDRETEKKMLRAARALNLTTPAEVVTTYLGAHALPPDRPRRAVLEELAGPGLKDFRGLAEFFDVFCEEGAFTLEESRELLGAARAAGFPLKIHAGQFHPLGGAGMAAALGAVSADHLEELTPEEPELLARHGTVAVLLPGAAFFLQNPRYPDGARLIRAGVTTALATDYNPGSCPCYSLPFIVALGVFQCGLSPAEAVYGATRGAAAALGRVNRLGSLNPGKEGDIIILNLEKPEEIPYYFGVNPVHRVFKGGKEVNVS
jgi:imidazolonepropionase